MALRDQNEAVEGLPGAELVRTGLRDLEAGETTVPALLVTMARTRLRATGLDVPAVGLAGPQRHSHALYALLAREDPRTAHRRYNALVARIVSFARAAEHARPR